MNEKIDGPFLVDMSNYLVEETRSQGGCYTVTGSRTWGVPEYKIIGLAGAWDAWSKAIESYFSGQLLTYMQKQLFSISIKTE